MLKTITGRLEHTHKKKLEHKPQNQKKKNQIRGIKSPKTQMGLNLDVLNIEKQAVKTLN